MSNEKELSTELVGYEDISARLSVKNELDYEYAGQVLRDIKGLSKRIIEYWEPLRVSTKKAYDDVIARKKQMLEPCDKAEKAIKVKMGAYIAEVEKQRKEEEERQRKFAEEEAARRLEAAVKAEADGDSVSAEYAMMEAEIYDNASKTLSIEKKVVKADGISTRKGWKITSIDSSKVPVNIGDVCIRPVDERAVLALIKANGGNIQIDGVTFEEEVITVVRS